jgi:hypothetical protein
MQLTIQGLCQSRKTAENDVVGRVMADFPNQDLVGFAKRQLGTITTFGASIRKVFQREFE